MPCCKFVLIVIFLSCIFRTPDVNPLRILFLVCIGLSMDRFSKLGCIRIRFMFSAKGAGMVSS